MLLHVDCVDCVFREPHPKAIRVIVLDTAPQQRNDFPLRLVSLHLLP